MKWLTGKDPDAGKDCRQKEMTEDEMAGWHHRLDEHEFEPIPAVGDGQGSIVCCSPWGWKELDLTERLNWTELLLRVPSTFLLPWECATGTSWKSSRMQCTYKFPVPFPGLMACFCAGEDWGASYPVWGASWSESPTGIMEGALRLLISLCIARAEGEEGRVRFKTCQEQTVIQKTWVRFLGWEDPLEKGTATHSNILENSMDCMVHGVAKSWTRLSDFHFHFTAAAKLLLSCPTLCNPIDGSPPGSSIHGILHARALEWVAITFSTRRSQTWKMKPGFSLQLHNHVIQ